MNNQLEQDKPKTKYDMALDILTEITMSYPHWTNKQEDITKFVEYWASKMVANGDFESMQANVSEWVIGHKFPPSLCDVLTPNPTVTANREVQRTKLMLEEQEQLEFVPPPWVRENMTREAWMKQILNGGGCNE